MRTPAIVMEQPGRLAVEELALVAPIAGDVVVEVSHSGVSTGTERLLWQGRMPAFPGLGYPLVPGYEAVGTIVDGVSDAAPRRGERVFVPGARCFADARALFGGAARTLVVPAGRVVANDLGDERGLLLALAATAHHALAGGTLPDLIVGHGVVGRLLARIALALGGAPPTVWEHERMRCAGAAGYPVRDEADDPRRDYRSIYDCSGAAGLLDTLIPRLARGGEIVLAGFYAAPVSFSFPPAFQREARLRVAAEWQPADMAAVRTLVASGRLSLDGLLTDRRPVADAPAAYARAFSAPDCLKMVLDWNAA